MLKQVQHDGRKTTAQTTAKNAVRVFRDTLEGVSKNPKVNFNTGFNSGGK
jgi:hypothetical protein